MTILIACCKQCNVWPSSMDQDLAQCLIAEGDLKPIHAGKEIITQGDWEDSIYPILVGAFLVEVKGNEIGVRHEGKPSRSCSTVLPVTHHSTTPSVRAVTVAVLAFSGPSALSPRRGFGIFAGETLCRGALRRAISSIDTIRSGSSSTEAEMVRTCSPTILTVRVSSAASRQA